MRHKKGGGRDSGEDRKGPVGQSVQSRSEFLSASAAANPVTRIRELEAELLLKNKSEPKPSDTSEATDEIRRLRGLMFDFVARAEKAEARVAELEAEIRVCVRHGMPFTKDEVEAREREAE